MNELLKANVHISQRDLLGDACKRFGIPMEISSIADKSGLCGVDVTISSTFQAVTFGYLLGGLEALLNVPHKVSLEDAAKGKFDLNKKG